MKQPAIKIKLANVQIAEYGKPERLCVINGAPFVGMTFPQLCEFIRACERVRDRWMQEGGQG